MAEARQRYRHQFRPAYSRLHEDRDLRWVVPFSVRYVIAIIGERFAGKSVALAYLSEVHGFRTYSLTDQLRAEALRRGIPLEPRSALRELGDDLRAENADPALLARLTLRRIHHDHQTHHPMPGPPQRIAVGGFKRPEELELFELLGSTCGVVAVHASQDVRYKRASASGILCHELSAMVNTRGRLPRVDKRNFARYIDRHDLEGTPSPWTAGYGQAVRELLDMTAAQPVRNEHSLRDLYLQIDRIVEDLDSKHRTPGW